MKILPSDASDEELLALVESWIAAIEAENYDAAYEMTGHEEYYNWTPNLIRQTIEGYGLPEPHPLGKTFNVTSPKGASGKQHHRLVERYDAAVDLGSGVSAVGEILYDLPLNGSWSDLTATFEIQVRGHQLIHSLHEIHVF